MSSSNNRKVFDYRALRLLVGIIAFAIPICVTIISSDPLSSISAFILFSILTYFCLGPFRKNTKGKGGKKGRRSIIYLICGLIMVAGKYFKPLVDKEEELYLFKC
jgi:hypothetical protein